MAIAKNQKKYRPNVAAIVINQQGLLLACARRDFPDCWQIPQGGIEPGETPEEGLRRELFEEIGIKAIEIIAKIPHLIRYDWPEELISRQTKGFKGFVGQEQQYFLVRLLDESEIHLDGHEELEFSTVEWVNTDTFLTRLTNTPFKKAAIEEAILYFRDKGLVY